MNVFLLQNLVSVHDEFIIVSNKKLTITTQAVTKWSISDECKFDDSPIFFTRLQSESLMLITSIKRLVKKKLLIFADKSVKCSLL